MDILMLKEDLFIGKGAHKSAYMHPENSDLCVKIVFKYPDTDLDRELKYRSILEKQGKSPSMLTKYYGTVKTNMGTGYVYEMVRDYDGGISISLQEYFSNYKRYSELSLTEILGELRRLFLQEHIVVSDVDPVNFLIQRTSKNCFTIRIVDNIGTPVAIPLAYYVDYFAKTRAKKYFVRFMNHCMWRYKSDEILVNELKKIKISL